MKNYKAKDHGKLSSELLQNQFTIFMINQYLSYVKVDNFGSHQELVMNPDKAIFEAHDDEDFDWFVSEFFKYKKIPA